MNHLKSACLLIVTTVLAGQIDVRNLYSAQDSTNDNRHPITEDISHLIAALNSAIEERRFETAQLTSLQLSGKGTNAIPGIRTALTTADPQMRKALVGTLVRISGEAASGILVDLAVEDSDKEVSSAAAIALEKRPIPRSLSQNELDRAISRMRDAEGPVAWRWASFIARSKDASPSDAGARISAILDRYEHDIKVSPTNFYAKGSYLSPAAFRLNAYLIVLPHIDSQHSIPIVRERHATASDLVVRRWLLFARGMCRDQSAADELRQFVLNSEEDVSERALALRAYVMAAGTNAIPLLESLTENDEAGYVPGHPPSEAGGRNLARPLQIVAKDELNWLKHPELRLKFRGY